MKKILATLAILTSLAACTSDEERIDGRWIGTISEEARKELQIEGEIDGDVFVVQFEPEAVHLNDTVRPAEYSTNKGRTLVKFENENRVLTIYHDKVNPDKVRMTAVGYFRGKIYSFDLERDGD
ncbi:hypothetical protein [Nisaea sediminum]|uniref:hypothetical protein n=1 Tax=Nisaea sediminum TaxID=2775867 RepID=UPI0018664C76|nr:hypothetical protein [Nisaea sediminum]